MLNEPIIKLEALDDSPVRGIPVDDVIINRNIVENKNFNIVLVERSFIFSKEENIKYIQFKYALLFDFTFL